MYLHLKTEKPILGEDFLNLASTLWFTPRRVRMDLYSSFCISLYFIDIQYSVGPYVCATCKEKKFRREKGFSIRRQYEFRI
jgi:hypothetical protein